MKIVIVTGIYPPDIGGPATHAATVADELTGRGHAVTVLTFGDGPAVVREPGLVRYPRNRAWPSRMRSIVTWLIRHRSSYDVVYALGFHPAAVAGARLAGRPVVSRIVADAAWERSSRRGLTDASFESFQDDPPKGFRAGAMRWVRDRSLSASTALIVPSERFAGFVKRWDAGRDRITVIPNAARPPRTPPRERGPGDPLRAVFSGRLISLKRVDVLIDALAATSSIELEIVGDGPERAALEARAEASSVADRISFSGSLDPARAIERIAAADVLVLPSSYDTSPFVVVEALACGVPVVGSAEGGLPEMVRDGGSGLLVDPLNAETLAQTLMRLNNEEELRTRLASGASADGLGRRIGPATDRIESVLVGAVGRPRGVWIGRAVVHRPLEPTVEKRFEILARYMDVTIISVGDRGKKREGGARLILFPRSPAFLSSLLFYFGSPPLALWKARRARSAVICQSPHSAFGPIALSRLIPRSARPRVIVEVHGDWRSSSRHYGGAMRRSVAPLADAVASWAVKRADRVRTVGSATTDIARAAGYRGEIDTFVTFSDLGPFVSRPRSEFPEGETVAFVGALERVKGIDVLLDAWDRVIEAHPQASLLIAGEGSLHERWTRPGVELLGRVPTEELVDVLDRSVCLVLPSRSEGTPRVILEAMARGRAVVASAVGAIPEMVEDGMTGRLVQPEDPVPLAAALIELLDDKERAARMGAAAADAFQERDQSKGFEAGMARTATWIGLDG